MWYEVLVILTCVYFLYDFLVFISSCDQGHVRHNWKVRKFVLFDEPAKLYYVNPKKVLLFGIIHLVRTQNFPKNNISYPPDRHTCVYVTRDKKC